jgi:hypothetical protein
MFRKKLENSYSKIAYERSQVTSANHFPEGIIGCSPDHYVFHTIENYLLKTLFSPPIIKLTIKNQKLQLLL